MHEIVFICGKKLLRSFINSSILIFSMCDIFIKKIILILQLMHAQNVRITRLFQCKKIFIFYCALASLDTGEIKLIP